MAAVQGCERPSKQVFCSGAYVIPEMGRKYVSWLCLKTYNGLCTRHRMTMVVTLVGGAPWRL